ncbi:hypothetical protein ZIOFF_013051 [Zingiber officinale]|uniref:WAT1-related protein n=1 Tax=Zingiber officinale TaxID=94328 RepID=A0A8J5LCA1_ZINOF|nr:hypothetical protein ZIOFF_013051 [Zingiber officinale]
MAIGNVKASAPYVAMLIVQSTNAGSATLCKLALEQGLNVLVLTVYRHLIALLVFAPLAFVLERNQRPFSLPFPALAKIFTLAFFGITVHQNVFYLGLGYASPTVASALSSAIPAFTFLMAVILRSASGVPKEGSGLCVGGVLVFTFRKGHLMEGFVRRPLLGDVHGRGPIARKEGDWLKGTGLILTSFVAFSAWLNSSG